MKFDDKGLPCWGPTKEEILACQLANVTPSWARDTDEDDAEDDEEDEEEEDEFIEFFDGRGNALTENEFLST